MARKVDLGRQASYRAEAFLFQSYDVALNQEELLQYCKDIHASHGDGKSLPKLEFTHRTGGGIAYPFFRRICLPSRGSSLMVLIHELAHIYSPTGEGHGPIWRRTYVNLVRNVIGDKEADTLVESFAAQQVPIDAVKDGWIRKKETRPRRKFVLVQAPVTRKQEISHTGVPYTRLVTGVWEPSSFRISPTERNFLRQPGTYFIKWINGVEYEIRLRIQMQPKKNKEEVVAS